MAIQAASLALFLMVIVGVLLFGLGLFVRFLLSLFLLLLCLLILLLGLLILPLGLLILFLSLLLLPVASDVVLVGLLRPVLRFVVLLMRRGVVVIVVVVIGVVI